MRYRRWIVLFPLVVFAGCGRENRSEPTPAAGTATAAPAATTTAGNLDETDMSLVHEAFSRCLKGSRVGLLVRYRGGKAASDSKKAAYERTLASPREIKKAIDAGARYVGVRDDTPGSTAMASRSRADTHILQL